SPRARRPQARSGRCATSRAARRSARPHRATRSPHSVPWPRERTIREQSAERAAPRQQRGQGEEHRVRWGRAALTTARRMRSAGLATLAVLTIGLIRTAVAGEAAGTLTAASERESTSAEADAQGADRSKQSVARARFDRDLEAMRKYRPGYRFWSHVFSVPDGRIA